jgi:hypothetical protein
LKTPDGALVLLPYPTVTVDMGQYLARMKTPSEIEALWVDYVSELATEARADPGREATTVVIGIHPFVVGTPDGAAAMRRVLARLKKDDMVRHSQGRRRAEMSALALGRVQACAGPQFTSGTPLRCSATLR